MKFKFLFVILFITLLSVELKSQDKRSQIPTGLQKGYFEVNIGSINYPFGQASLADGYTLVDAIVVPHTAVRLVLAGYDFNKYLSGQIIYIRPVLWVKYKGVQTPENNTISHAVRMNIGGLTLKGKLPLSSRFSLFGEAGLGVITRKGFSDEYTQQSVVTNAGYATVMMGGGVKYHINDGWALQLVGDYVPGKSNIGQPHTSFLGAGFSYNLRPLSEEKLQKGKESGYIHPKQWIQIGYSTNVFGYGINKLVSGNVLPIFWGGDAQVKQGLTFNYQRNIFHNPKVFALDWGVEAGFWQSNLKKDEFFTLSLYPVFRLNFLHTKPFDAYFYYSVASPTFISKIIIDDINTGEHFTFQDNMGVGFFFGKERNMNAEIKIGHYSNGNLFPYNDAVMIPLSFNVGYCF
ncbi:MAG: acyloxyacyl hydrolase [Paludibacter sp.]|nr:acyloxyacyl hydrolase [Paludibacter sp.]